MEQDKTNPNMQERTEIDFYRNGDGLIVFTEAYHLDRGFCCGAGCLHCPFVPRAQKSNREVDPAVRQHFSVPLSTRG